MSVAPRAMALAAGVFLAGCAGSERADLVIHNGPEPETIDPQLLTGQGDGRVAAALFEGLTRFNPTNGAALPGLASGWDVSPDGRTYTFRLRPGLAWSTGEPITAADFIWSWRRAVAPSTAADYSGLFFYLENGREIVAGTERDATRLGVAAPDPLTVTVRLVNPTPFFPEVAALRIFAAVPRHAVERHGERWIRSRPLPCSGPYVLEDWRVNDRFVLRANPRYWDATNVASARVDLLCGDNPYTALNLFLRGDVDFVTDRRVLPGELGPELATRRDFHRYDYLGCDFIRFNTTRRPFTDARVRRAFAMAIDRRRIVDRITRMGERPTSGIAPEGAGGYAPPKGLRENPDEARRLLAEAGYAEGAGFPPVEYAYNAGTRMHAEVGVEIQSMLRARLGVRVELRPLEWKTYLSEMSRLNYDFIRGSWVGDFNDPSTFLDCFLSDSGNNRTGWRNPEYDRLLETAARTPDRATRHALLRRAETLLVSEETPVTGLYGHVGLFAFDPDRVTGIWPNLTDEHPFHTMRRARR